MPFVRSCILVSLLWGGVGDLEIFFGRGRGVGLKMKRGITYMSRYQEGVIEYECQFFFYLNGVI